MNTREDWISGVALTALLLVQYGTEQIRTVYKNVAKVPLMPPAWLFGPVWLVLYIFMAVAMTLWNKDSDTSKWTFLATWITFVVNVAVNKAWTPLFYAQRFKLAAFDAVLILLSAILVLIFIAIDESASHRTLACILWSFYVAWTAFACYLSIAVAVKTPARPLQSLSDAMKQKISKP